MAQKAELRASILAARARWGSLYRSESDRAIEERLLALPEWRAARSVFSYVSVRGEPSTRGILAAALSAGKRLSVPLCEERGIMRRPAPFGLLEPGEDAPIVEPGAIDLAIIPCLAADRSGHRLGHGAGYYDRYLPLLDCPTVCLCRGRALVERLPSEPHDIRVKMVLTEGECLRMRV